MIRIAVVANLLAVVLMIFAASMLVPLGMSLVLGDRAELVHAEAFYFTALSGALLWLLTRRARSELQTRDGFVFVVLVWTVLPAFATLPLLGYLHGMTFTDAYFEAMAGLTATGGTVLSALDGLPLSLHVWRALLQWFGGMGVIVLAVAVLPLLGIGGRQILRAETPGPMKEKQLTPRIAQTAKGIWYIYALFTALCVVGYYLAGMPPADAFIHAFTTVSLGGFSSHDASFAHFQSSAVEAVAVVFMLVAGINFGTHFVAFRRLSVRPYFGDPEVRAFIVVVGLSVFLVAAFLFLHGAYQDFGVAARYAAFNVVSAATTTGYATADYNAWPQFAPLFMVLLSGFCTCSLSAGGGIKMMRALVLFQTAFRELLRMVHPRALTPVKLGGQVVEDQIIFAVLAYMLVYGVTLTTFTMLLVATGVDFLTAFSAASACINNLGPGLGFVGPAGSYALLNDFQTWICTAAMLLGRLELITVFVVLTPAFWRR
jgi:trk system potassium uptake protein TrkH